MQNDHGNYRSIRRVLPDEDWTDELDVRPRANARPDSTGTAQYTVFAPTNAAFESLYDLLSDVLDTPIDDVTDLPPDVVLAVLRYHVTTGRRAASAVVPSSGERSITTLLGQPFAVRANGTIRDGLTGVRPTDARIVTANVSASNGIVHAIDAVIVPPSVVQALTN